MRSGTGVARPCDYLTFVSGWVLFNAKGEASKAVVAASLSNCTREGVVYTLPLGAVRAGGRLFWIVQASSWATASVVPP